jgi:hypothetical protein
MHTAKKKREELQKKKKTRHSDKFLVAAILTPKTAPKVQHLQKATPPKRKQCTNTVVARS